MQQIINKPLASTFGWLHMNGTLLEVPEEPCHSFRREKAADPG